MSAKLVLALDTPDLTLDDIIEHARLAQSLGATRTTPVTVHTHGGGPVLAVPVTASVTHLPRAEAPRTVTGRNGRRRTA